MSQSSRLSTPTIRAAQFSDFGGDMEVRSVERHKNPHDVIFGNILGLARFGEVICHWSRARMAG